MSKKAQGYDPPIKGIIQVTGPHDVGKTTFALECGADPARILFVDDDIKGRNTVEDIISSGTEFGRYVDFAAETRGKKLFETFEYGLNLIEQVKPNQYDVVIWDTWTRMGSTFKAYVTARPSEFRAASDYAPIGKIKGAQQWQEAQRFEAQLLGALALKVQQVFLVTHLKDHYHNDARTGKSIPDASKTLARICTMRLWLLHNITGSPIPTALVLKRPSSRVFMPSLGIRTENLLPRKLVPGTDQLSLWDRVLDYINEPAGNKPPDIVERPTALDLSILEGTLTKEQQQTLSLSLAALAAQDTPERAIEDAAAVRDTVIQMDSEGSSKRQIREATRLKIKEIRDILK